MYSTHKKLIATVHRSECACKRAGEPSETFCDKGEARERANDFLQKKIEAKRTLLRRGAGGRTRTGTVSPPVDFESTTSANSITPAYAYHIA